MRKINLGVLNLAKEPCRADMNYEHQCAGCRRILEVSATSHDLLQLPSSVGVCEDCADLVKLRIDGSNLPSHIDPERAERILEISRKLFETMEEVKEKAVLPALC